MRALLDVNVLIALLDAQHVDHRRTRAWLGREIRRGWSSCAITQNGFVRVMSQPRYPNAITPAEAADRLAEATLGRYHEFWPCDLSLLDSALVDRSRLHGPRQVTDVYLLALATSKGGRFVTFDGSLPRDAVPGARASNLVVL
jgi:toxin-antitoxin system PIN domain toxin